MPFNGHKTCFLEGLCLIKKNVPSGNDEKLKMALLFS